MTTNPVNTPLFARFAFTHARTWVEPVPGGCPKHPWLFFMNAGFASGRLELSGDGVAFTPARTSRVRGMGRGFMPWTGVIDLGVFPRQGIFEASTLLMRLHQRTDNLIVHTFSMSKLLHALYTLRDQNTSFPPIIT